MKLVIIVALSVFIRLYNVSYFASYGTETAQHYLEIIKLLQGNLLLNGPFTSHPWLRLGAVSYYLFFPVFYLSRFHPLTLFYLWTVVDIMTVFLNYSVVRKIADENTALVSSLFLSVSPLFLLFNRVSGFYNFVIPLTYILVLLLNRVLHKKTASYWPIFFIIGLMINLHASSIFLIPFFVGLGIYLKKFSKGSIVASIAAFLIPNIPFLASDYSTGFGMSRNLLLWLPYKILNFISGKTLGVNRIPVQDETAINTVRFFQSALLPPYYSLIFGVFIITLLLSYFFLKKNPLLIRILFFWLFFGTASLMIHKNPPLHYFIPIAILPIILIAYIWSGLFKKKNIRLILIAVISFVIISDLLFIFSPRYLFLDRNKNMFDISYQTEEKIAKLIIKDVKRQKFSLSRIGSFDDYIGGSKENYEYLLWWLGNRPVQNSPLKYIIVEDKNRMPISTEFTQVAEIYGITIMKK